MTIGAIILDLFILFIVIGLGIYIGVDAEDWKVPTICIMIGIILLIAIVLFQFWYYGNSESGKRAIKTQKSNYSQGIERRVQVYDVKGKLIKEYEGKFDLEYDDDRILFDDEKGKRHIIYYSISTVIIDELEDKNVNKKK